MSTRLNRTRMQGISTAVHRIDLGKVDAVLAGLLALDLVLESLLATGVPASGRLPTALLAVPFALMIAVRRRWPAGALIASMGLALLQQTLHGLLFTALPSQSAEFVPILCSYGVGAWLDLRRGAVAVSISALLLYTLALVATYVDKAPGKPGWSGGLAIIIFFLLAPWLLGCVVREYGRRAAAFAALEEASMAERVERQRAAVATERVLIGRELQDIIAHNVSMMVVQAAGARRVLHGEPDRARESMLAVEQTGRAALAEMRRLLGLLRTQDDPRALAPQPGLDQLSDLAHSLAQKGLTCELSTEGDPIELTPGINLVAYRVLEASLNGAAHGGCRVASATVRYFTRRLEVEVQSDRALPELAGDLGAISERVGLYGGALHLGEGSAGQFDLRCELPLEA